MARFSCFNTFQLAAEATAKCNTISSKVVVYCVLLVQLMYVAFRLKLILMHKKLNLLHILCVLSSVIYSWCEVRYLFALRINALATFIIFRD